MIYDLNEIANLPDTFSLEDLRVVCHISKRTARYYLRAGLIPCEISEKKTHCYTIRKQDLLDALKEYQKQPCKFAIPKALNDEKRQRQEALKMMVEQRILSINCLPEKDLKSTTLKKYYQKRLENCRDMLQPPDIEAITGYPRKVVRRWCVEDKLHCIMLDSRIWVKKKDMLSFLCSGEYNSIMRKSQTHLDDIHEIYRKIHRGG